MTGNARILVVDDQPTIVDLLSTVLTGHGFAVDTAGTAAQAVEKAVEQRPDLVLLDVSLPDGDGIDVRRRLRAEGAETGVVFLSARDTRDDLVAELAYGDEDWITKPFDVEVLLARVHAALRRLADAPGNRVLRYADVELDQDTGEVRRAGEPIALSPSERELLRLLLRDPGRVLSHDEIRDGVWPDVPGSGHELVKAHVASLRRKLERAGPPLIATHRGFGYALRARLP
ncbi:response regulator transcription factor [Actinoplanes sp. CA-051413]|uniref:response regulator transcription factor n=1 Tax=Actinoplanes sp. CA-051413 TaxID=3239899 RepID=UPI003D977659